MRNDGVTDVIDVVIARGPAVGCRSARHGVEDRAVWRVVVWQVEDRPRRSIPVLDEWPTDAGSIAVAPDSPAVRC